MASAARLDVEHHLGIGKIGKSDLAVAWPSGSAEVRPEIHQPVLRLTVDLPESLAFDVVDAGLHQFERYARPPELMADGEALDLGEFAKKSYPKATRRFSSDKSEEVSRDQVVAIEFFLDRAILLGKINSGTDGGHQHEVVGIARDAD